MNNKFNIIVLISQHAKNLFGIELKILFIILDHKLFNVLFILNFIMHC